MNLACYDNFIGIRSEKDAEAPTSGLYIDDLPGIDLKRMASIAADKSGLDMIKRAMKNACDEVAEEALNFSQNGRSPLVATNPFNLSYIQSKFRDNVLNTYNGEKGIEFDVRRPDFYQYSRLHVREIYVKASENASGVVVKIVDGTNETELDAVDLVAGEVKVIETDYYAKTNKVSIVTDHSTIQFYQAYLPYDSFGGCRTCGGRRRNPDYSTQSIPSVWVTGGHGISASVVMACNIDRIKCFSISYLKYAILYKTAMNLALEGEHSDRLNFYTVNMDFETFYNQAEENYHQRLERAVPHLPKILKPADRNCFSCGGLTKTRITY
jgi:hypothetical protein